MEDCMAVKFQVDLNGAKTRFDHYWGKCIGSCHAAMALRRDWQDQLKKCHDELGFQYVRFHGLFNDDMSVLTASEQGQLEYSFHNVDLIYDFLLSIGMKPFVELSFMPTVLASGKQTIFHYSSNVTPPKDFEMWGSLVREFIMHLVDRYGIQEVRTWFFEVWNEPNLEPFWAGSQQEYFKLYRYSADAVKKVDPEIPVGGPATARNAWISDMIQFCRTNNVALDFISSHHYPTDACLGMGADMELQMAAAGRGILTEWLKQIRYESQGYPLYYTEWNNSPGCRDTYHDEPYCAAFVLKTIVDNYGLVDIYSFWTFSDLFEELSLCSVPFSGCFGLLNIHGIAKPAFRAFQLLHNTGNTRYAISRNVESMVEAIAVGSEEKLSIIAYNHNVPLSSIKTETVKIEIKGLKNVKSAVLERIDDDNANVKKKWVQMGQPTYLKQQEINALMKASEMVPASASYYTRGTGEVIFDLSLPPHGIAAITIQY
jgi:xylan 1,4-beta-xylosidase